MTAEEKPCSNAKPLTVAALTTVPSPLLAFYDKIIPLKNSLAVQVSDHSFYFLLVADFESTDGFQLGSCMQILFGGLQKFEFPFLHVSYGLLVAHVSHVIKKLLEIV